MNKLYMHRVSGALGSETLATALGRARDSPGLRAEGSTRQPWAERGREAGKRGLAAPARPPTVPLWPGAHDTRGRDAPSTADGIRANRVDRATQAKYTHK